MSDEKIIDEEGHFHVEDEAVDLSGTIVEGWAALAIFWALGLTVFYQFVTRYVLNDSAAWTEEVARYLLIGVVFVGVAIGVAKNMAIQVDFFYRYMPAAVGRWMSRLVDALRIAFFAAAVVMTVQMMLKIGNSDADDDRRCADEHRLRRRPARLRRAHLPLHPGGDAPLAARLQRARAADDDFRRRLGAPPCSRSSSCSS